MPVHVALRIAGAVLATALALAIGTLLLGVAPTFFGYESFAVYSGSMEPALKVGSLAVVKGTKSSDMKPGDIITYRTPTQPDVVVTHRLVAIETTTDGKQQYRTKGDANATEDLVLVEPNAVLGRVVYSVPYAGFSVEFARTERGRLLIIVIPALVLALDFLRQRLARGGKLRTAGADSPPVPDGANPRVFALLRAGWQAMDAGHLHLAERAADGVLTLEPRSEDAWLLKAESQADTRSRLTLLRTALSISSQSQKIADRIAELEQSTAPGLGRGDATSLDNEGGTRAAWR